MHELLIVHSCVNALHKNKSVHAYASEGFCAFKLQVRQAPYVNMRPIENYVNMNLCDTSAPYDELLHPVKCRCDGLLHPVICTCELCFWQGFVSHFDFDSFELSPLHNGIACV